MDEMTAKEAKRLIGQRVQWEEAHDAHRGTYLLRVDTLLEVAGRNVRLQDADWRWLPHLTNFRAYEQR